MKPSLYEMLSLLVSSEKSGRLGLSHSAGLEGEIYLDRGRIAAVQARGTQGPEAAKEIAQWLNPSIEFNEGAAPPSEGKGVPAPLYVDMLKKADRVLQQIRRTIPDNQTIVKLMLEDGLFEDFEAKELKVALLLDGRQTVEQVLSQSGLPQLETLSIIYRLLHRGRARKLTTYQPMDTAARQAFQEAVRNTLLDLVGPAAEVIMAEAFESMKIKPELLAKEQVPELIASISRHLDPDETAAFKQWAARAL